MANVKITDLTAYTNPASTDVLPIVDVGADITKKVSIADLLENAGSGTASAPGIAFDGDSNTGIYRPGAGQLAISTNGTGRLFVDANGQVGVGTSPAASLHISAASPSIRISETDQAVDKKNWDIVSLSGSLNFRALNDDGSAANRYLEAARDATYGITALKFFTGSDQERLRITSDGKVGLGISSPSCPLHVSANSGQVALFERPSGGTRIDVKSSSTTSLYLDGTDSVLAFVSSGAATPSYTIARDNTDNTLRISQATTGPGVNDLVTINTAGNVGIGTTSPGERLEVANSALGISGNSTNGQVERIGRIKFGTVNVFGKRGPTASIDHVIRTDSWGFQVFSSQIAFSTAQNTGGTLTQRAVITNQGTFGIGTATPAAGLDVNAPVATSPFIASINSSEAARIDSSGRLLVGTSTAPSGNGAPVNPLATFYGSTPTLLVQNSQTTSFAESAAIHIGGQGSNYHRGVKIACINNAAHENSLAFIVNKGDVGGKKEAGRFDYGGRLLVGTSTAPSGNGAPVNPLATFYGSTPTLLVQNSQTTSFAESAAIHIGGQGSNYHRGVKIACINNAAHENSLAFIVNKGDVGGKKEAGRFDYGGRLLVGTSTSVQSDASIQTYVSSGSNTIISDSDSLSNNETSRVLIRGTTGAATRFGQFAVAKHSAITNPVAYLELNSEDAAQNFIWVDNSGILRISSVFVHTGTTSGTVVGTQTSDERVKNVLGPVTYGLDTIKQIEPVRYSLKSEPDTEKLGFIAQQVQPLVPQSVFDTGEHIEGEPEDAPTKLGMEYVALIPVLVNAVKELSAEVDALKAQLQAS